MTQVEQNRRMDASLEVRKLAGSIGVRWPMYTESLMMERMIDIADETNSKIDSVRDLMMHRWYEYRIAIPDLKWAYGTPEKFLNSHLWDDPNQWPWKEKKAKEPGLQQPENKHIKEMDDRIRKYREDKGLPPL